MFPSNNNTLCLKCLGSLLCLPTNALLSVPLCLGCFWQALWVPILTHNKRYVPGFEIHYAEYSRNYILAEFLISKIGDFVPLHILSMSWNSAHPEWFTGIVFHHIPFKLSCLKALIFLLRGRSKPNENRKNFSTVPPPLQIYALKLNVRKYNNCCCYTVIEQMTMFSCQNKWQCFLVFLLVGRWAIVPGRTFKQTPRL